MPDRFQREVVAALHVEDAGAEAFVALAPECQFFDGADGVHGVEMAGDQDARLALFGMGKAGADAAGKTLPAGDALDGRTHDRHLARGDVEHALDRGSIPGRAFAFHPAAQPLQHGLGIKGKIGWVHGILSIFFRLSNGRFDASAYENDPGRICKVKHRQRPGGAIAGEGCRQTRLTRHALDASLKYARFTAC